VRQAVFDIKQKEAKFMSKRILFLLMLAFTCAFILVGCGDDGSDGAPGSDADASAMIAELQAQLDAGLITIAEYEAAIAALQEQMTAGKIAVESCATCHSNETILNGDAHQAKYDVYADTDGYALDVTSITLAPNVDPTKSDVTLTMILTQNGTPVSASLASLFEAVTCVVQWPGQTNYGTALGTPTSSNAATGEYTITKTAVAIDPAATAFIGYVELANKRITWTKGGAISSAQFKAYETLVADGLAYGTYATKTAIANVSGCVKCHAGDGKPYLKHGHIDPAVTDQNGGSENVDFLTCQYCHNTSRESHATDGFIQLKDGTETAVAYHTDSTLMNDVHMSHAMEFGYPQGMNNCVTCHEGYLNSTATGIFKDANFTYETCRSCHGVAKLQELADATWPTAHPDVKTSTCLAAGCHANAAGNNGGGAGSFAELHNNGYSKSVFTSSGVKYADEIQFAIDKTNSTLTGDKMHIVFTVDRGALTTIGYDTFVPSIYVAAYGYNTKDFLVSNHNKDANEKRLGEYTWGGTTNPPYFTAATHTAGTNTWAIDYDITALTNEAPAGAINRIEIAIAPKVTVSGTAIALSATSETYNITTANKGFVAAASDIVEVNKCNTCHEQLTSKTFHVASGRGGSIVVCRMCHVPTDGAGHYEMQSKSIDSYVHSIHSFQTEEEGYYPNFTVTNCESGHKAGTYNVPDQSKSLPGVLSASTDGTVPEYVTGPASRACGSCHRATDIREDDASSLASLNAHVASFGYLLENAEGVFDTVVKTIMAKFE
jgi:hypothetical protein